MSEDTLYTVAFILFSYLSCIRASQPPPKMAARMVSPPSRKLGHAPRWYVLHLSDIRAKCGPNTVVSIGTPDEYDPDERLAFRCMSVREPPFLDPNSKSRKETWEDMRQRGETPTT